MPTATEPTGLTEVTPDGRLRFHFHAGQWRAWESDRRVIAVIAGSQSGKSTFGPPWLYREIQRRGPGDYMVVTPTYPLLSMKALPAFLRLFKDILQLGEYVGSPARKFTFSPDGALRTFGSVPSEPTVIYFGHASEPDSLEALTAKAAWLDEAGQKKFKLGSWEAIGRRLSVHRGRCLITTTPYDLGWLKQRIWDRWHAGDKTIDVIRFDSTENPAFPVDEFDRARDSMPRWRFDLFYRAIFTRPAGMIYDCFDEQKHKLPRFAIPIDWQRYCGLDFGGVNTAGVFFAEEPGTKKLYAYREYKHGGRTAREHANALKAGESQLPLCVGGSHSEGQWRDEFCAGGLPVQEPAVKDVEVGIQRVYAAIKKGEFYVFDDLTGLLEELATYSRVVNDRGETTEEIDEKSTFHFLDAVRYIVGWAKRFGDGTFRITIPGERGDTMAARSPAGVFGDKMPEGGW